MKGMIMWLLKFFQESDGKPSMTRLTTFGVVSIVLGVYASHNIVGMIKGTGYVNIGISEIGLLLVAMGSKVAQSIYGKSNGNGSHKKEDDQNSSNGISSDKTPPV